MLSTFLLIHKNCLLVNIPMLYWNKYRILHTIVTLFTFLPYFSHNAYIFLHWPLCKCTYSVRFGSRQMYIRLIPIYFLGILLLMRSRTITMTWMVMTNININWINYFILSGIILYLLANATFLPHGEFRSSTHVFSW